MTQQVSLRVVLSRGSRGHTTSVCVYAAPSVHCGTPASWQCCHPDSSLHSMSYWLHFTCVVRLTCWCVVCPRAVASLEWLTKRSRSLLDAVSLLSMNVAEHAIARLCVFLSRFVCFVVYRCS
ncbi:hypothetical protein TRVL_10379 [Trypanosoma vivax]|nr:hypothetical protein TRVL_10379 [Trypanosoma vivax]